MNTFRKIFDALFVAFLLLIGTDRADALPIYGVSIVGGENRLLRFDSTTPGMIDLDIPITGLEPTEMIHGIDFRPLTGQLYAVGQTGTVWRLYTINTATGVATAVGSPGAFSLNAGSNFGFDFDPAGGFFRAVSNADENILINPNNGALSDTGDTLTYADGDPNEGENPNVVGLAYFNNVHGATATTLYGIDVMLDILVVQSPAADGNLMTKGSLGVNTSFVIGFDIATASGNNTAYATLRVSAITGLYAINLTTGAATPIGMVGNGNPNLVDMAVSLEPQTFVVTDTTDPGNGVCDASCNLREAIIAANAKPGPDRIHFSIPGGGVRTILPATLLPPLTDPVTINGYTQTGASTNTLAVGNNAQLRIQLDGQSAGNIIAGLVIRAARCTVVGLVINRCPNEAIIIEDPPSPAATEATGNAIVGNFIGTDSGGTIALGNGSGVTISTFGNFVGGTSPANRNVISGSTTGLGILVNLTGGQNVIYGNYIGTDKNGTAALPNDAGGILILSAGNLIGSNQAGSGNLVSGNSKFGIEINGGTFAVFNNIRGNLIGTNATGSAALGNENSGVLINHASHNTVGGPTSAERNVISGNGDNGVYIHDGENNRVLGNFIGTDAAGQADLGNDLAGVLILGASGNFVGGTVAGEGNLLSGNNTGVYILGPGTTDNRVQGNRIGTDASGGPLGNTFGIAIVAPASDTVVGGTAGAGNTIAFNSMSGVFLGSGNSNGNDITGNSIFSNNGLGIDLQGGTEDGFGVTANDSLDADTGANRLQNYPVLTSITGSGSTLAVQGLLNSAPNTGYNIDFYRNAAVDPSGFGEGQTHIGFLYVQTDQQGHTSFSLPLDSNASGQYITATATDPAGNTSEFSMASSVVPGPAPTPTPTPTPMPTPTPGLVANVSTRLPVGTDDNVLIEGFIVQGTFSSSKKIIVRALGPFLTQFGITGALANPTLEILDANNTTVAVNDDWKVTQLGGYITSNQVAEITQSGLAPSDDLESALIVRLPPGSYTAVVRGLVNTTGTGVVDAYDLSPESAARLANVATRGLIQPGDQLMIAGFIIQQGDARAVVRAIGPSLSVFGITNALPDTTLQLRDVNGAIVRENDDWQSDQKVELEATGLQPGDSREAAIVATLPPGQYTVQLRGKPETTGIGVVEIYFLQ